MPPTTPKKDKEQRSPIVAFLLNRTVLAGFLVLAAVIFLGFQLYAASKRQEDQEQLTKVKGMIDESMPKNASLTDFAKMMFKRDPAKEQEFRDKQKAIREEAKKLSPESRRELMQGQMKMMTNMTKQLLAMPKSQQNAVLDLFIDGMEAMRKQQEQRMAKANSSGNESGGGDRPRRPPVSDEERDQRRREFFDNMPPEDRATFSEGIRAMNDRRRERGMPPMRMFPPPRR